MMIQLAVDRFEGKNKETAVLVDESGRSIDLPRDFLPKGTKAGEVLSLTIERDMESTGRLATETRSIQDELKKRDPGGDITL